MTPDLAPKDEWDEEESAALAVISEAEAFQITDAATYEAGVAFRRDRKAAIAGLKEIFTPLKKKAQDAHKAVVAEEAKQIAPHQFALDAVNKKLDAYDQAQRRERAIAEARAAEEARRLEAMRPASSPGEARPPVVVPAVSVPVPRVEGFGFSVHHAGAVVDKMALIRAVASGSVSADVLEPVQSVLDLWARHDGPQTKASENPGVGVPMPGVPGVTIVATRRARG